METFIHFQFPCGAVAGKMDHVLWTPKQLQAAAVSNRFDGWKNPTLHVSPRIFLLFQSY